MTFVVSEGQVANLDRGVVPSAPRISLASDYTGDYAEIWRSQPHVRTVVSFLARNIAQIGLHTFRRASDVDRERLTSHPLAALLAKPNPRTTKYRLIDALVSDLGIYDVACWLKVKTDGQPRGLVRLPPSRIEPIGDSWLWAEGIRMRGSRGKIDVPIENVVLFHGYSPTDSRWGVSPMETLRGILAEEFEAGRYRQQLWRNGARFPGYISRPKDAGQWSDGARERFRSDWRGLYSGSGPGAGGTPLLEDGMSFSPTGVTPAQAQYLESRKLTREEVAAAFHIPLPMVGILDHATFSNIAEQHKQLYQDTLGPWLAMIQDEIGLQLIPEFDSSGRVYVEFNLSEKLRGSFEEQATSLQTAVGAPWLTRNEARARQNLPQIAGGDDLVTPLNVLTGGQASPTDSAPKAVTGVHVKARVPSTYEAKAAQVLARFFARQRASVLAAMGGKAKAAWWDGERWDRELGEDLARVGLLTASTAAAAALAAAGGSVDDYDESRTVAYVAKVAGRIAAAVNTVTKAHLDDTLASDEPNPDGVFEVAEKSRSVTGAATFVSTFSGFGTVEAGRQTGAASKTWETGANARPSHAALDGETVPIGDTFSNGLDWPGSGDASADETAGCNCSVSITY